MASCRARCAAVVALVWLVGIAGVLPGPWATVAKADLPNYQLVGTFALPAGTASYDLLPDGRAMAIVGESIWTQSAVNSSAFGVAGSVPAGTVASFGASFLRISPSGTRVAVGDNDFGPGAQVFVFDPGTLSTAAPVAGATYQVDNYDAHWSSDHTLYVSGGNFTDTLVTRLDASLGAHAPVITGIAGASGGITTDGTYLYTANGFAFGGPSAMGDVKAFALASLTPGTPVNFETQGTLVARVLSGNTLGFDHLGNLLVGGGPGGFAAVVDGDEVQNALVGGPMATTRLELSPTTQDSHFIRHNPATGELLVTTFGDSTVHRYAVVPAPGAWILLGSMALPGRRRRA